MFCRVVGGGAMLMALLILQSVIAVPMPAFSDAAPVDFVDGGLLRLRPGAATQVMLMNNTAVGYEVTVAMADGVGRTTGNPQTVHLDAGGFVSVTVTATDSPGASGFLVAVARSVSGPAVVVRRPFRVVATSATWTPLVTDWRVTSFTGPVTHGLRNASLPLANGASCGDESVSIVVGGVARPAGGAATVTATCHTGQRYVELSFDGLAGAGDYTGTIDLAPDVDGGTLTLTVRRTDGVLFPAVVLLAGIVLALLAAWQSGRLSALSRAREEAWLVQATAASAQLQFRAAGEGATWQTYTFLTALNAKLDIVRAQLRGLRWLFSGIATDKGPYKEQLDALIGLRAQVDAWAPFAGRLATLAASRDTVAASSGDARPSLLSHVDDLLRGRELEINEVSPLIADVDSAVAAMQAWPADARAVQELHHLGARLADAVVQGPDRQLLAETMAVLDAVREAMWTVQNGAAYNSLRVGARLETPKVELEALRMRYFTLVPAGDMPGVTEAHGSPTPNVPAMLHQARESAAATARRIALSRRLRNTLAFLAIAGVTMWTGLTALYFDHAFGTWRDYVAIGVWGFGAQAGLTVFAAALDQIIAGGKVVPT